MSQQHTLTRHRRFNTGDFSSGYQLIDPVVIAWANQVVANGGSLPTLATRLALSDFVIGLKADGVWNKFYAINCFVNEGLTACLTPLITTAAGANPWANHNFTGSDLTADGLLGDGSVKYLDTGLSDTVTFTTPNSYGFTLYDFNGVSNGALEGIITNDDQSGYLMACNRSGNAQWYDYGPASGGTGNIHATSPGAGYYSGNRLASNSEVLYFANSVHAHAALVTGSGAADHGFVGINIYIFTCNSANTSLTPDNRRISYVAVHQGLTLSDSASQFSHLDKLKIALGGGRV